MATPSDPNTNPYQPPVARVIDPSVSQGAFIPGGRNRPAGAGLTWIGQGWKQFTAAPGPWLGITVVYLIIIMVISFIPGVSLVSFVVNAILIGGVYLGCRAAEQGQPFEFSCLFAGFSTGFGRLAAVGGLVVALNLVFFVVVGMIMAMTIGVSMFGDFQNAFSSGAGLGSVIGLVSLVVIVGGAYLVVVSMLALFAPMLAVIYDQPAMESLKGSFSGCMRNMMSLTVFGLAWFGLCILCIFTLGLGFFVLIPVIWAALYHAARDIYEA